MSGTGDFTGAGVLPVVAEVDVLVVGGGEQEA